MYQYFLSLRFFRSRFLTLAAFLSTMFGVAMLLIVQSVMGGYMSQLKENIRGQEAHLRIIGNGPLGLKNLSDVEDEVGSIAEVSGSAPFIERLAVYRSGVSIKPVTLAGIDPVRQAKVSDFASYLLRPNELTELLRKHHPGAGSADEEALAEVDMPLAIGDVHSLLSGPEREPLSDEELRRFFDLEWRIEVLKKHRPLLVKEFPVPPAGIIVGIQSLLDRQLMLGQVLTVITLSPDTGREISERFLVTGAINTGDFQLDDSTLFADVQKVRSLLNRDLGQDASPYRYQGLRISLDEDEVEIQNLDELNAVRDEVALAIARSGSLLAVQTWPEIRANLLKAVGIEKLLVYFIVLILIVFTGSMILLMLTLTVIEKTKDVGVLMSLGAPPGGVTKIFLFNGLLISMAGTAFGLGLGYAFSANINEIHDLIYAVSGVELFPAEIYQMDRIPVHFYPADILWCTLPPVIVGLLASLVPATWAPRRDPIGSIQYE
ncbi:MAG: FtsX-like permease family protein [Planctomycetota bacterium]|nr:FtsX-like permease family protein [Planctomycetota bacterium]